MKRRQFKDLSVEEREQFAERIKERIYSTITLLAIVTATWHTAPHHTSSGALAIIIGSVTALWLATIMSARMSYHAVHGRAMPRSQYRTVFFAASGLFAPAVAPALLVILSWLGGISLSTALLISIVLLLASLFLFSALGNMRVYQTPMKIVLLSLIELGIGLGVVALKLVAGE